MSKVEGGVGRIDPPPPKASCNYFFFEASWFNTYEGSATQFVQETKDSQVTDA